MEEEEKNKKEVEQKAGAKGEQIESQKNEHSGLLGSCTRVLKRICGMKTKKQCFLANFKCERSSAGSAL